MTHEEKEFIWNSIEFLYNAQQKDPLKFTKEFIIISKDNYYKFIYENRDEKDIIKVKISYRLVDQKIEYHIDYSLGKIGNFLSFIKPFMREIKLDNIGI